jgi:hypothetical protein
MALKSEIIPSHGTSSGTYRFTVHHSPGHPPPNSPSISSDLLAKSCGGSIAGVTFRASDVIKDLSERISLMLASIDPDSWDRYRQTYIETSERFDSLKVFDKCPIQCFVGYYLFINIMTTIHRGGKDPPDGWVAMVVLGNFTGGHLYIPDLGISLPYNAGDVIFFRSWALKHFISHFQGNRYVVLFSTSRSIFEWLETLS